MNKPTPRSAPPKSGGHQRPPDSRSGQPQKAAGGKPAAKPVDNKSAKSADEYRPSQRHGVPQPQPGHPPMHRIPIVDHKGNMRGHVGHTATQATVARFLGRHGAKLGKHEGRTAWIGDKPPPPPPPDFLMGPGGPMVNPHGRGTDKPPFPPGPDKGKGEAEIGLINAKRDAVISGAKAKSKSK